MLRIFYFDILIHNIFRVYPYSYFFFTDPGRTGRLVPEVRRWACCARAAHHDVSQSGLKCKFLDAKPAARHAGDMPMCVFAARTEGKALVNVPRSSQQTQTLVYLSHQERPCCGQSKYN